MGGVSSCGCREEQRFLSSVLQQAHGVPREFFKHAIPSYLVRSTEISPLRLPSKKKMTTANATIVRVNESILSDGQKKNFGVLLQSFSSVCVCVCVCVCALI